MSIISPYICVYWRDDPPFFFFLTLFSDLCYGLKQMSEKKFWLRHLWKVAVFHKCDTWTSVNYECGDSRFAILCGW